MISLSQHKAALLADDVSAFWKELTSDPDGMDSDSATRLTEIYLRGRTGMFAQEVDLTFAPVVATPTCVRCYASLLGPIKEGSTGACQVCGR